MIGPSFKSSSVPSGVRLTTTIIACAWGLASAYVLFYSLLVKFELRNFFLALFPLVVVWAAIERKRWGRLALLGVSSAALGFFAACVGLAISGNYEAFQAHKLTLQMLIKDVLALGFQDQPQIALAVLVLAVMTAFWMCRPNVRAEYEGGKKSTLAIAQRAIAMTVVGCWGVTFLLPTSSLPVNKKPTASKQKIQLKSGKHTSMRDNRAAESRTSA